MQSVADIYRLKREDFMLFERMGDKLASNLLAAIENSKQCELGRFIFALGIRHVGERTARSLAQAFGSLENLQRASFDELVSIRDIGATVAQSICTFFANRDNLEVISRMLEAGVNTGGRTQKGRRAFYREDLRLYRGVVPLHPRRGPAAGGGRGGHCGRFGLEKDRLRRRR